MSTNAGQNYRNRQKWINDNKSKRPILDKPATTMAQGIHEGQSNRIGLVDPIKAVAEGNNRDNVEVTAVESQTLKIFTYDELRSATRNFRLSAILGVSDGEPVYKGWVDSSSYTPSLPCVGIAVAIRILNKDNYQSFEKWQAEVNIFGKFSHPNVVKLLGYCHNNEKLLLVYEYMQNASLEDHLFKGGGERLPWDTRIKIAIGAAQGLAFLHRINVIHRDVKSSIVLLDGDYNVKLTDFVVTMLGPVNGESHASTRVMGTPGYAAPEYYSTGHVYVKSNVYGFGVMMLEIITGLRVIDTNRQTQQHNLVEWAKPFLSNKKRLERIMDKRLDQDYPSEGAWKAAKLILSCLHPLPDNRPSIEEVLSVLLGISAENVYPVLNT